MRRRSTSSSPAEEDTSQEITEEASEELCDPPPPPPGVAAIPPLTLGPLWPPPLPAKPTPGALDVEMVLLLSGDCLLGGDPTMGDGEPLLGVPVDE